MLKFYICRICGNLIEMVNNSGLVPSCCDEEMEALIPGATDGTKEKHIPVWNDPSDLSDSKDEHSNTRIISVKVGDMPHPMELNHAIKWIAVLTNEGVYRKKLDSSKIAQAEFCLKKDEKIQAVYAYCNLHGLWVNEKK